MMTPPTGIDRRGHAARTSSDHGHFLARCDSVEGEFFFFAYARIDDAACAVELGGHDVDASLAEVTAIDLSDAIFREFLGKLGIGE